MAQLRFLHLGVNFTNASANFDRQADIEAILNQAKDWFRYAPNCWLIYTVQTPAVWHNRLKEGVSWITQETYLIPPIYLTQKSGWLRKSAWEWINQTRS